MELSTSGRGNFLNKALIGCSPQYYNDFRFLKFCHNMQMIYGQFLEKCQLNQPTTYCQIFANSNEKKLKFAQKGDKIQQKMTLSAQNLEEVAGNHHKNGMKR